DIRRRQSVFVLAPEIYGFVAKGREGGEAAEDADEDQNARFRAQNSARLGEIGKKPDGSAAEYIDRQSSQRKTAAAPVLHQTGNRVTKCGPDKATDACQKQFAHFSF